MVCIYIDPALRLTTKLTLLPTYREKQRKYVLGSHLYRIKHELVLQWKTTPRVFNAETQACKRIMRVSPLDLRSSPSICLMKHILSDKVVTLITPDISTFQEGKPAKQGW